MAFVISKMPFGVSIDIFLICNEEIFQTFVRGLKYFDLITEVLYEFGASGQTTFNG